MISAEDDSYTRRRSGSVTMVGVGQRSRLRQVGPHIYVIGEVEAPKGPVKIGLNSLGGSRTGRPGLSTGNWRQLEVLHRKPMAFKDLRWTEWIIHTHLT